ncbi:MAG: UMP kinase [Endomicrobium sp.]|jgi:uridylate kinase|nr:UMP kinase [Endomicrobium sp.]
MSVKRVLLKLSGETFSDNFSSISICSLTRVAKEIKSAISSDKVQLAIVVGAGNIWRGRDKFVERVAADKMGMLATVINSFALNDALEKVSIKSNVFSASGVCGFSENFNKERAIRCIDDGNVVIFAGGTGNPFFTTDTAAALRAAEIKADMLLKATQVDGVYAVDPKKNKNAVKFDYLTFDEALKKHLKIMDVCALSLCMQTNISVTVFDFYKDGNLKKVLDGEKIGTLVEV